MNSATVLWLSEHMAADEYPTTLEELLHRPEWHEWAACRGRGQELFIVERGGNYQAAKALCAVCPVDRECLAFALADEDLVGFWAGTTESERRRLRGARSGAA